MHRAFNASCVSILECNWLKNYLLLAQSEELQWFLLACIQDVFLTAKSFKHFSFISPEIELYAGTSLMKRIRSKSIKLIIG